MSNIFIIDLLQNIVPNYKKYFLLDNHFIKSKLTMQL